MIRIICLVFVSMTLTMCNQPDSSTPPAKKDSVTGPTVKRPEWKKPAKNTYHFEPAKNWLSKRQAKDTVGIDVVLAVNRIDKANLASQDSIIVPDDLSGDVGSYMPFPLEVKSLKDVDKIVFFSYPSQTFAAYEQGVLVYTGPTNMGSKKNPTPEGLYFSNWKAEETISTFNDEWELKWNFNIENKEGIGWHQYALPGYPASHSCLRLLEKDAKYLYDWASEWTLKGADNVIANGTPTIVFGTYPFGGPKPWHQLVSNAEALTITEAAIDALVQPNLQKILAEQEKTRANRSVKSKV